MRIREGDKWKAIFQTNRGLFEPLVMYFGMCNSLATFQLMMDTLFCELIMLGKIVIYMDDILIFTQMMDEHKSIVKQVLQILADNKLLLHLKKCKFHQTKIEYLEAILSQDSIETDPTKTKGVAQWPESVRATGHKTPGESSEIRMRLLEGCSTLYTGSAFRVSVIGAKLVCLSITSKQAKVALECCHAV